MTGDEEKALRLATVETPHTGKKTPTRMVGSLEIFRVIVNAVSPQDMDGSKRNEIVGDIKTGVNAALDDFYAAITLEKRPNIEIDNSKHLALA